MFIRNIADEAIRVICPRMGDSYTNKIPKDIEGTLIAVIGHEQFANKYISRGKYLKLIYDGDQNTEFVVRFDNDVKLLVPADYLLLRDFGKLSNYKSIWEEDCNLEDIIDTRVYYKLQPLTRKPKLNPKYKKLEFDFNISKVDYDADEELQVPPVNMYEITF